MGHTAADVMTGDVQTIKVDATVRDLIEQTREKKYSGLPVVDENGVAVGLVSQNDVLRALAARGDLEAFQVGRRRAAAFLLEEGEAASANALLDRPVRDIMTPKLFSCLNDTPLQEVCRAMADERIHRLVVVAPDGTVIGLIAATDLVRKLGEVLS